MPSWHSSWWAMRGARPGRSWMTLAELDGQLRILGWRLSRWHIRQAIATDPPPVVKGGARYTDRHLSMAAAYAKAKGLGGLDGSV